MICQSNNQNKVRVITIYYIEILLQVVFIIWFLYPTLYWVVNNINDWVNSIQPWSGLFNSTGNQPTIYSSTIRSPYSIVVCNRIKFNSESLERTFKPPPGNINKCITKHHNQECSPLHCHIKPSNIFRKLWCGYKLICRRISIKVYHPTHQG